MNPAVEEVITIATESTDRDKRRREAKRKDAPAAPPYYDFDAFEEMKSLKQGWSAASSRCRSPSPRPASSC